MSTVPKRLESEVMKLPLRSRARLAEILIASLDDDLEASVEDAWIVEAHRRDAELRSAKVKARAAEKVFKRARAALR